MMTANRILTADHADLVPASPSGREQVARRENPPKNTISNAEISNLIGPDALSESAVAKGLLREIALRISGKKII
jgi:hypothetical protein